LDEQYQPHKLGDTVIKTDGKGRPLTASMLRLTLRQALSELRGGPTHTRAGITKNKGRRRNPVRAKMAKASRKVNQA
jgi:hypothetical protein